KGLKQGDPLSPFLFILIMESLHLSVQRVVDEGMFHGINLSHMFYADDVVFVGQWSESNISTSKVPWVSSLITLESIRCQFFNGHDVSSKKASWVQWNKVLAPKDKGGLGVSSLYALNRGLMFKWVWRFLTQDTSLWARVIKAIPRGVYDVWCEGGKLKDRFPRAYALESCKTITVGSKLVQPNLTYSFRRTPRGGAEQTQTDELAALMQPVTLSPISDRWTWTLNSSGEFSVASVRNLIDVKMFPEGDHKTRWIRYVPIKVNTHAWKVMTNSLPTRFNISRRGIDIDSITYANCDMGVETTSHLFFTCDMAQQVARLITRLWDVPDLEMDSYERWKIWMVNLRMPSKNKKMLVGVFYVMWWLLWDFRNKKIFEDMAPSKAMFFDDVICKFFYWCCFRSKASFSWNDWLKNPSLISL
ncbi:RNA-directed DNA polymerase, eukaryota, reverse transcriptase zinc-binding domain protein, partial [Tanacetum coccineum]